ncbi:hypothetical protein B0H17DRAFT_1062784 [Mycena rosella]|uniref:Uncharacterized protein n=1 Tax=Mycena rosella TaxID=1033263 RepID=A0AAD7DIP9_MYCRO|nr:hypothetical protein B0H17DRAFT_1062784 [Mycena rosella]
MTALHWACYANKPHIVRILLEHGADIQVRDAKRHTALDIATAKKRTEIRELLLQHSAGMENRNGDALRSSSVITRTQCQRQR